MNKPLVLIGDGPVDCSTCLYWKLHESLRFDPAVGHCRRRSPFAITDVIQAPNAVWPITNANHFCGDYTFIPRPLKAEPSTP